LIKFIAGYQNLIMKACLVLLFILIGYSNLSAQDSTFVTIKAGFKVSDVLTAADIYYYPQFTNGKVFYRDGTKGASKMNYNRLYGQMLFIDPKADTLALTDEKTIFFIAIDHDTFFYDEGYMRLIVNDDLVKLAEKQTWIVADVRKMGTHNRPATTVAITSFSTYTDGTDAAKSKDLILNEEIVLRKKTEYYFGDEYNHFVPAGKKKILLLFPKEEQRIENYLKENKVNFDKKDDLEKLAHFLAQHN